MQPSQSKRLTKGELIRNRKLLVAHLKKVQPWTDTHLHLSGKQRKNQLGVSLDVYKTRVPVYHTTVQFLRTVAKDLRPKIPDIFKFASDTEEALFLFDESIAEYLTLLFRKALRLHAVEFMRSGHEPPSNFAELVSEETELALWFTEQYDVVRARFSPFLKLADHSVVDSHKTTKSETT